MNKYFEIKGNKKLSGKIRINGAKNSVLALLIASTMTDAVVTIEDIPKISDVDMLYSIFEQMGSKIITDNTFGRKTLVIDNADFEYKDLHMHEVTKFRASYYLMGAMVARYKKCSIKLPGGCYLGPRPIDLHLKGLEALGCTIKEETDGDTSKIIINTEGELKGTHIFLDFPSVGATINIMLAASMAVGETTIENAAKEPEIIDIATMLNNMGANIRGAGTNEIKISGRKKLNGCCHQTLPDRIEAGTYLMYASLLGNELVLENVIPEHLESVTSKLEEMGCIFEYGDDTIKIKKKNHKLFSKSVKIGVYPSFPTDLQQIFCTMLTQCSGTGKIIETIFPDRFRQVPFLEKMGANISLSLGENTSKAEIKGITNLKGCSVNATDLRAGAALVFAGLLAEGTTRIYDIEHVLRGYDDFVQKLQNVGADIKYIEESNE